MTERKWTPGPWVADTTDPSDVVIWCANEEFVANVGGGRVQPASVAFDADAHNAHLIAAAPDLYEALEACKVFCDSDGMVNGVNVRAALAKARGE